MRTLREKGRAKHLSDHLCDKKMIPTCSFLSDHALFRGSIPWERTVKNNVMQVYTHQFDGKKEV
jgi:hypothetical protein